MAENEVEVIGRDVLNVAEWPFKHLSQLIGTLAAALKNEPQVKTAVVGLISAIESLTADIAADVAANGLNVASDVLTATAAESLLIYVQKTFLPAIEAAYKDIAAAVENQPPIG